MYLCVLSVFIHRFTACVCSSLIRPGRGLTGLRQASRIFSVLLASFRGFRSASAGRCGDVHRQQVVDHSRDAQNSSAQRPEYCFRYRQDNPMGDRWVLVHAAPSAVGILMMSPISRHQLLGLHLPYLHISLRQPERRGRRLCSPLRISGRGEAF